MLQYGPTDECGYMFLGLLDPDTDPEVRSADPGLDPARAPDPNLSVIKQKSKKNLSFYCFVTSL
jgi:hypothetical protein